MPLVITHALARLFNFVYMADLHMLVFINCMSLVYGFNRFIVFHLVSHLIIFLVMCALVHTSQISLVFALYQ